jgi:valyl-tRNA synthetase
MPFLTEELWHAVYDGIPPAKSIALTRYPGIEKRDLEDIARDGLAHLEMLTVQSLVIETRALRKESDIEEKAITPIRVRASQVDSELMKRNCAIVERLARVSEVKFVEQVPLGLPKRSTFQFDVAVVYERTVDVPAERERLTRDIAKYEKGLAAAEKQLGNERFLAKAPAQVVEGLKKQESETRMLLEKARSALGALPPG